jgi:hypothetical protein
MGVLRLVVGLILLILGRKLFWLFVGCVGFAFGFTIAQQWLPSSSSLVIAAFALAIGFLGALLAIFLQGVAIVLSGFAAGVYIIWVMAGLFGLKTGQFLWLLAFTGGVVGALLLFLIFDWALIFISSIAGAALITEGIELTYRLEWLLFFVLMALGTLFQARVMRNQGRKEV